jgi:hypothetical protein
VASSAVGATPRRSASSLDDACEVPLTTLELGIEPTRHRRVYGCNSSTFEELPRSLNIASKRFVLFVAADVGSLTGIDTTLAQLLDCGCVYLCAWGPGCEQLHDAMDDIVLNREFEGAPESTIMTTWHSDDSLQDAAEFALLWAIPDADLAEGCDSVVLASIGNPNWGFDLARIGEVNGREGVT